MKLSQKQAMMLYEIVLASLPIVDSNSFSLAFDRDVRAKLVNEILNQQDTELVELEDKDQSK